MATTRLQLEQQLSEVIGDYLQFQTSTNIGAASTTVVATALQAYDGGKDDYFNVPSAPRIASASSKVKSGMSLFGFTPDSCQA